MPWYKLSLFGSTQLPLLFASSLESWRHPPGEAFPRHPGQGLEAGCEQKSIFASGSLSGKVSSHCHFFPQTVLSRQPLGSLNNFLIIY